jgi:high-affinity Fe2+/Pb2+ permease
MNLTHIICVTFCVLVLKVVVFKPSLVVVLKESKCMCMSYIIINPHLLWIEIYEYFDEFINLCIFVDAWCILVL